MAAYTVWVVNTVESIIKAGLAQIEAQEVVRVLYACESGSRAWGFASQDSDFDVRFIYIHPASWYLGIYDQRDVIERPVKEGLDLSGWDIRKALKLFRKSNPPLLEWLQSPTIYQEKSSFIGRLRDLMPDYYSARSCLHHYLHMAQGNFEKYLAKDDEVSLKKYFYVLRPVLACIWIERDFGVVPMEFATLVDRLIEENNLKNEITALLAKKMNGVELDRGPRLPAIHAFLEQELTRLANAHAVAEALLTDTKTLDELFQSTLVEAWN